MIFYCGRTGTKGTARGPHQPKNKWKVVMWTLDMETECYFRFLPKICTRCKGISWKVNPSRMDFPWILRLCYFRSLSLGFWILSFVSLLFALSSGLSCLPMSNTSLLLQNCKLKHSLPPLVFFIGKFSAANSTKLCSAFAAEKSRKETEGNPYWLVLTRDNSTQQKPSFDFGSNPQSLNPWDYLLPRDPLHIPVHPGDD